VTQIRSPFIQSGGQFPIVPPPSPGALWGAAVTIIQQQGVINQDQFNILAPMTPTSAQVDWMLTDPTTRIPEDFATKVLPDVPAIEESYTESVELGWTGLFANRFQITADVYWQKKSDFISPLLVQTPLLTMNGPDIGAFIGVPYVTARTGQLAGQGMPVPQAQAQAQAEVVPIVTALASAPLGVVASEEVLGSARPELIVTYRNVGDLELWGGDVALEWFVTDEWTVSGSASAISDDYFRPEGTAPVALNAPEFKGNVGVAYRNVNNGFSGGGRIRFQSEFPAESAGYVGTLCIPDQPVGLFTEACVEASTIVDLNAAYRIPSTAATLQLVVNNVFNSDYRSFVGVPNIGRFAMLSMRYDLF
jgi:iron complex outermembrane receptor protein